MTAPVLHALAWPGGLAGMPRSVEESCAALLRSGVDAHAWLCTSDRTFTSPVPARFAARGVPTEVRTANTWADPRALVSLVRALRRLGKGAVLHTHGERALLWGAAAARLTGARHVHTLHGWIDNDPMDRRRNERARRLLASVDLLLAVHPSIAEGATVVPNTLDPRRFARGMGEPATTRRHWGLGDDERVYLFLGRLSEEKGADRLAMVQTRLQSVSAAARLFVAGRGPLLPGIDAMTDVRFLGERDDPASVLAAADVVLMPSRREGHPMTALEAAAVNVPLVGFPAGGLADSGLAVTTPPGDVNKLVDTAVALVREPGLRAEALRQSRDALEGSFAPRDHAAMLARAYEANPAA